MNNKGIRLRIGVALLFWMVVVGYMVRPDVIQFVPSPLLKAAPIILLAVYSALYLRRAGVILTIGLVLSACGDIAGDVPGGGFVPQVGFFLFAQIAYIIAFTKEAKWNRTRLVVIVPLVAWMCFMTVRLMVSSELHNQVLATAVGIYLVAITGMAISAILHRSDCWWVVAAGAVFFVFSDSVIAWSRFIAEWPNSGRVVMWSYYLAQFLIAFGYTRGKINAKISAQTMQVGSHKGYT
ncbi:MAG: lysoplasmalogenase [Armatimonadota bacterium]